MNKLILLSVFFLLMKNDLAWPQDHKGINFQAVIKSPAGTYPTTGADLTATVQILTPNGCVLREETHSGVKVTNGFLNVVVGSVAAAGGQNPTPVLSLPQVFDNSTERGGLTCVDENNNVVSTGTSYPPQSWHARKLRLRVNVPGEGLMVADFNMRAVPFAVNAESVADNSVTAAKLASDIGKWSVVGDNVYRQTGRVGIGTASPQGQLHVFGNAPVYFDRIGSAYGLHLMLRAAGGSIGSETAVTNGQTLGRISFQGHNGTELTVVSDTGIAGLASENWTPTANGSSLHFFTVANGTTGRAERIKITNNGLVGIGTAIPQAKLHVNGDIKFGNSGEACNSALAGSQRYNATDKIMEYCNGTDWTDFNPSGTMCGFYSAYKTQACRGAAITDAGGCPSGYTHTKMEPVLQGNAGEFYTCVKN